MTFLPAYLCVFYGEENFLFGLFLSGIENLLIVFHNAVRIYS